MLAIGNIIEGLTAASKLTQARRRFSDKSVTHLNHVL